MGSDIDLENVTYQAMADELEKIAAARDVAAKGIGLLRKGIGSVAEGWKRTAPAALRKMQGFPAATELREGIKKTHEAVHGPAAQGLAGRAGQALRRTFGAGTHLMEEGGKVLGGGARRAAEELSRRGWTGQSRATKYIPLGERSQMGLGVAGAVPGIVQSARGEGPEGPGVGERIGGVAGGLVGGLGGYGRGMLPSIASSVGGGMIGGRLGRTLDRPRTPREGEQA